MTKEMEKKSIFNYYEKYKDDIIQNQKDILLKLIIYDQNVFSFFKDYEIHDYHNLCVKEANDEMNYILSFKRKNNKAESYIIIPEYKRNKILDFIYDEFNPYIIKYFDFQNNNMDNIFFIENMKLTNPQILNNWYISNNLPENDIKLILNKIFFLIWYFWKDSLFHNIVFTNKNL